MADTRDKRPQKLNNRQRLFVQYYLQTWNGSLAAEKAGYKHPKKNGARLLSFPLVKAEVEKVLTEQKIKASEVIMRTQQISQVNAADFLIFKENYDPTSGKTDLEYAGINWDAVKEKGYLVKGIKYTRQGIPYIELHDPLVALDRLGRHFGVFLENNGQDGGGGNSILPSLPADLVAPEFLNDYRDIRAHNHTEYLEYGGRASTKSSFISLVSIWLLVNNPGIHMLALRQVANTLRDSVYAQLVWAINELDLGGAFSCTTSPLEIKYKPTGQTIYFRGADDPGKIKSIKTKFGYIGILWFEELDQFHGEEAIRKIEQSVIRGGDLAYEFKSWNPPQTANNWVEKYKQIPKANQFQHHSTYLTVPPEWLGKTFIEEAEHLKAVNPKAYEHEYLGVSNGTGGLVFENVQVRKIEKEELDQFDHILMGVDWGYYPDPFAWVKCHYDAARHVLYLVDELRMVKAGNRDTYNALVSEKGVSPDDLIIADSAEPKSVADYLEYGLNCRGAEKGPESVKYSMKWLQSLAVIVVDPERCPNSTEELLGYELEQDKDGNFISAYPDRDNHFIDATRYSTNLIWRRRGQ